jgi:Flp pilus assembly protein TadG
MKQINNEKGQALIMIAIAAVVLMGFAALAIDGARVFEDKRHAQNAADTAALAGALAYSRDYSNDAGIQTTAQTRATENGYDDNGTTNDVTITVTTISGNVCPANLVGKEIEVQIDSTIGTTFGRILGRDTMSSTSVAVARACGTYSGPPFTGNAIVSLSQSGIAIGANGAVNINITGGGLFSNSTGNPSVDCDGGGGSNGSVTVPSVTIPSGGSADYGNCSPDIAGGTDTTASQYSLASAAAFFPESPACDGVAQFSGGTYYPQAGADGSRVAFDKNNDMHFAPGVYCFTSYPSGGSYGNTLSGDEVTFYSALSNFSLGFQGGGGITATAPSSGDYKGILIYLEPVVDSNGNLLCNNTQELELHGNGAASIRGAVIAPSAEVNITGNPDGGAYQSQVIGCTVSIGGSADVTVQYDPNTNYQTTVPYTLSLLE